MHTPTQHHHCQYLLAVPQDAVPPLADEVEVEMAVVQVVEEAVVSFKDLVQVPVRERPTTIHKRLKPPSTNFTSDEDFTYVQGKRKGPKKRRRRSHSPSATMHMGTETILKVQKSGCHVRFAAIGITKNEQKIMA